jgi:hypothetical protein
VDWVEMYDVLAGLSGMVSPSASNFKGLGTIQGLDDSCYPRFLVITRRSCLEAHGSYPWSTEIRIDLIMALEGPSFSSSIIFVLSAIVASISIDLVLYHKRFLLHEVIGPRIMVCVTFDH